jgi:FMN phosphatase YigB (HAD superfamily)
MHIALPKYKAVSLDLRETVVSYRNQPYFEYRKFAEKALVPNKVTKEHFNSALKSIQKQFPNFGCQKGIDEKYYWTHVVGKTLLNANIIPTASKVHQIADALFDYYKGNFFFNKFFQGPAYSVYSDAIPALKKISSTYQGKIKFGILTNNDSRVHEILKYHKLDSYFNFVVVSAQVKMEKPDAEIFNLVASSQKIGN